MDALRIIDINHGGLFYSAFNLLAFFIGFFILVLEGHKRKFPILPWLLIITTSLLFFVMGAQAIKFSNEDWQNVLQFKDVEHSVGRSVLGGILLGIPGLLLAKYLLKFRNPVLDALAWAAPLCLLFLRVGCHLAGCCFGTPTSLPWRVQYGVNSHAFHQHIHDHLITATQQHSLAIHPVALYEAFGCMIIMLLLSHVKHYVKASGSLFLSSLGLYTCLRFVIEFFRAGFVRIQSLGGVTSIQMILIILIPVIIALILYREKKFNGLTSKNNVPSISVKRVMMYYAILLLSFVFISRWLSLTEVVIITLTMLAVFLYMSWQAFKSITIPSMRLATFTLMAASMVMMSQTLPETSRSDTTKHSYNILSIGALKGYSDFNINDVEYDCDGNIIGSTVSNELHNAFNIKGVGYTRVEEYDNGEVLQYGVDAYWGTHTETDRNLQTHITTIKTIPIMGVHPYIQYDWRLMGAGVGFHVGTMTKLTVPGEHDTSLLPTTVREINLVPSAYFRIGYVNRVFGEIKIGQQFPSPFPGTVFQTNIGLGIPRLKGAAFRIGTSSYYGVVIAPSLPLGKYFILEPYVAGFRGLFKGSFNDRVDHVSSFVGSLSLRYKFGMKVKP